MILELAVEPLAAHRSTSADPVDVDAVVPLLPGIEEERRAPRRVRAGVMPGVRWPAELGDGRAPDLVGEAGGVGEEMRSVIALWAPAGAACRRRRSPRDTGPPSSDPPRPRPLQASLPRSRAAWRRPRDRLGHRAIHTTVSRSSGPLADLALAEGAFVEDALVGGRDGHPPGSSCGDGLAERRIEALKSAMISLLDDGAAWTAPVKRLSVGPMGCAPTLPPGPPEIKRSAGPQAGRARARPCPRRRHPRAPPPPAGRRGGDETGAERPAPP